MLEVLRSPCLYLYMSVCVFVCLSASVSQKPTVENSLNFLYTLPVAVARFCSDDSGISYELPLLRTSSRFHVIRHKNLTTERTRYIILFILFRRVRQVAAPGRNLMSTIALFLMHLHCSLNNYLWSLSFNLAIEQ